MRSPLLDPYFLPFKSIKGIGATYGRRLESKFPGGGLIDLLWIPPRALRLRHEVSQWSGLKEGTYIGMWVTVRDHRSLGGARSRFSKARCVVCETEALERIELIYFNFSPNWLRKIFPMGSRRFVVGRLDFYNGNARLVHPDPVIDSPDDMGRFIRREVLYPVQASLPSRTLARIIQDYLPQLPELPEWHRPSFVTFFNASPVTVPASGTETTPAETTPETKLPSFLEALTQYHQPQKPADLHPENPFYRRLASDEWLAHQMSHALVRRHIKSKMGTVLRGDGQLTHQLRLPFALTSAQKRVLDEIKRDLSSPGRMFRLLQGDVGSGKTLVAFLSILVCLEAGGQAVLMAPTEILAQQHYKLAQELLGPMGVHPVLLTSKITGKARKAALHDLQTGVASVAIGTHALYSEAVAFRNLELAIIDEQHRFGVGQRLALLNKGEAPHVLMMTATPIPRTQLLALFGNMDISTLDEKPAGRKLIETLAVPSARLDEIYQSLNRLLAEDPEAQIFWVCPAIENESELVSVEDRYRTVQENCPNYASAILHGKQTSDEKEATIQKFAEGSLRILVATTVIEVGVDIQSASLMVIEHAERFGLAQLHQLRGRVGRGQKKGICFLLWHPPLTEVATKRLHLIRHSNDGFYLADKDLDLRGGGDMLRTKQSGLTTFIFGNIQTDSTIIREMIRDTQAFLEQDPELQSERGRALRILLALFRRDEGFHLVDM